VTINIKKPALVQWVENGFQDNTIGYSAQEVNYKFHNPEPAAIAFNAGPDQEMLKISKDGFYVRGVKVEQDEKEAEAVYKAFKRWMVENELRRSW
jgi:hypothetical protein